jgi:hypothetical protein
VFIYTLPILFTNTTLISPTELGVIVLATLLILLMTTPETTRDFQPVSLEHYLFRAWTGVLPLAWVALPFFLLLNGALYAVDSLAKAGVLTVSSWDDFHLAAVFASIWWAVSVWRCSANTPLRWWAALARLATLLAALEYALKLLVRIDYPRVFFICEELLLDYGSCF